MLSLYNLFKFIIRSIFALSFVFFIIFFSAYPSNAAADYGKQTLIGANFSNSDLKGATFYLTNLQDADLSGSNLQGASFFDAKLKRTNLSNTNLENSTLDAAIFDGANLSNAYLADSFAFNTKFINVNIEGSDFSNVLLAQEETNYLCSIAEGVNPISKKKTLETLNCQ